MSYGYSHAQLKRFSKKTDYCCCTQTVFCVYCAGQGKSPRSWKEDPEIFVKKFKELTTKPTEDKPMKTPHKHAELIKAWADGAKIEFYDGVYWVLCIIPRWHENYEYRIKPEPKPDVVLYACTWLDNDIHCMSSRLTAKITSEDNLKLTFDGTTKKLIKAEVI